MKKSPKPNPANRARARVAMLRLGFGLALLGMVSVVPAFAVAADRSELGRHLFLAPNSMPALTDEALLDSLQRIGLRVFLERGESRQWTDQGPQPSGSPCSIAAQGFGITAICIAIEHGWVSREEGLARIRLGLETLWNGNQGPDQFNMNGYKGLFYHFLDINSGVRVWSSESSTIDTALLMAGVLDARQYFTAPTPPRVELRALADALY